MQRRRRVVYESTREWFFDHNQFNKSGKAIVTFSAIDGRSGDKVRSEHGMLSMTCSRLLRVRREWWPGRIRAGFQWKADGTEFSGAGSAYC